MSTLKGKGGSAMSLFWIFLITAFWAFSSRWPSPGDRRGQADRKCRLLLPLCPVYGLGALGVQLPGGRAGSAPAPLPRRVLVCTGAELLAGLFYEKVFLVPSGITPTCPSIWAARLSPLLLYWGALTLMLYYLLHPAVAWLPPPSRPGRAPRRGPAAWIRC